MTRAIVTGATGFVGIHLVSELLSQNVHVTALCRENSPNLHRLPPGVDTVYSIDELPQTDVFYHLAWEGASGPRRGDACLQTRNAEMTLDALLTASRLGCRRFIALGTVYERLAPHIKSSGKSGGADFYILSKEYAHSMSDQLAYKLGIEYSWCTICHPIGRFIKPEQMIAFAVTKLLAGEKPAFGPALTLFDIVAVEDVAQGLYLLGQSEKLTKREYYIGSGFSKPLHTWLEDVRQVLGVHVPIGIGERPDDGLRFDEHWFDITPLIEDTGYTSKVSFAQALFNVKNWVTGNT
jgi:nucleoside-diphosphate-sugar epimerase